MLMYNNDCVISVVRPTEPMELLLPQRPWATSCSSSTRARARSRRPSALLPYREGDYLVIPRGTTWRLQPEGDGQRLLVVEAFGGAIQSPKRYRNEFGQLLEHSPYCERDLRAPTELPLTRSAASSRCASRSTTR